jgi:predicted dehydrogenase/aryl-alcohol dehydrogenase-like predicted oxidoreductase
MERLQWGIIGTGAIAKAFAHGIKQSQSSVLTAVGSRSQASADVFGDAFDVPCRHGSYNALLADPGVQAVYISTPHPMHAEWAVKAAEAGKHVLCEKPLALNQAEGLAVVEAARENGVFLMEAFMYRCHPQTAKLVELVRDGVIGDVRMIRATFGFGGGDSINPESRMFANSLGGGGIMDVGCYPVSAARLLAAAALGRETAEPIDVVGLGQLGDTAVDEWAAAVLKFEGGLVAQVATAIRASLDNVIEIVGSKGRIHVPDPWMANRRDGATGRIEVTVAGEAQIIELPADRTSFSLEADVVAASIDAGRQEAEFPAMTWADTLGNLAVLDRWRAAVGVVYEAETPKANRPIRGLPLRRRDDANMTYGTVAGLDKPVSRLIMGCDNKNSLRDAAPVWDDWIERGGNTFDTGYVYGRPRQVMLGEWIRSRGVREQVNILCKGAHTPFCTPEGLTSQLLESLEDFGTDCVDIYTMHRDNPEIPVGEFIDVLDEHAQAGRIKVFGGSNWTIERFKAANEYARAHDKQEMTILNNNLSLARMVHPIWGGCVHVSDEASRQWLTKTGTTVFSWSSQARGYFIPDENRDATAQQTDTCWDAPDNRARRARAQQLAQELGVSPLNIATAYVIGQPFPAFALIGPRTIHETATTMPGLNIELSPEQLAWLWGGE